MPNYIEVAGRYLTQAIDKIYIQESVTRILENGRNLIDLNFKERGWVKIAKILLNGASDYRRVNGEPQDGYNYSHHNPSSTAAGQRDGFGVNGVTVDWELYRLRYLRATQIQIDHIDNEENGGLALAFAAKEFVRTKMIPETDEIRLGTLAANTYASVGNRVTQTISAENALGNLEDAFTWLTAHGVPAAEQVIFVSTEMYGFMAKSPQLAKYLIQGTYRTGDDVQFQIMMFEGRPIIPVSPDRFFTNYVIDPNNGYHPSADSKLINFIVCAANAGIPIVKVQFQQTYGESTVYTFYGTVTNLLWYHDMIVPTNKITGIYCSVSETAATTASNVLSVVVNYVAANTYDIPLYVTNPAGLRGTLVEAATAFTIGQHYDSGDYTVMNVMPAGNYQTGSTAHNSITGTTAYFALIDDFGNAVAVSAAVTLPTAGE